VAAWQRDPLTLPAMVSGPNRGAAALRWMRAAIGLAAAVRQPRGGEAGQGGFWRRPRHTARWRHSCRCTGAAPRAAGNARSNAFKYHRAIVRRRDARCSTEANPIWKSVDPWPFAVTSLTGGPPPLRRRELTEPSAADDETSRAKVAASDLAAPNAASLGDRAYMLYCWCHEIIQESRS
jgi:hypothetical protein